MASYAWSTGDTTETTWISQQAVVTLSVIGMNGCQAWSRPQGVVADGPFPQPTINQVGYTLESSPSVSYQWFYNGAPIAGATDQTLDVYDTGDYFVQAGNANGCTMNSDTLFVLSTGLVEAPRNGTLVLWPVPAQDEVTVALPEGLGAPATLELSDAQGRLVMRRSLMPGRTTERIRLEGLASGIYAVRIADGLASWSASVQVR
jgi:hypothetical protein